MPRMKRTRKEWNSLPLYAIRTICVVDNIQLVIENGEIVDTVRKIPSGLTIKTMPKRLTVRHYMCYNLDSE